MTDTDTAAMMKSWSCSKLFEDFGYSLSHPDCVTFRQFGNKKDGFPRVHIDGSITVRLSYSKCPVEERLLGKKIIQTIRERERAIERERQRD